MLMRRRTRGRHFCFGMQGMQAGAHRGPLRRLSARCSWQAAASHRRPATVRGHAMRTGTRQIIIKKGSGWLAVVQRGDSKKTPVPPRFGANQFRCTSAPVRLAAASKVTAMREARGTGMPRACKARWRAAGMGLLWNARGFVERGKSQPAPCWEHRMPTTSQCAPLVSCTPCRVTLPVMASRGVLRLPPKWKGAGSLGCGGELSSCRDPSCGGGDRGDGRLPGHSADGYTGCRRSQCRVLLQRRMGR